MILGNLKLNFRNIEWRHPMQVDKAALRYRMCDGMCVYHGMCVEDRGQLLRISSLPPPRIPESKLMTGLHRM